jgi:hypothetical protein
MKINKAEFPKIQIDNKLTIVVCLFLFLIITDYRICIFLIFKIINQNQLLAGMIVLIIYLNCWSYYETWEDRLSGF